MTTTTKPPPTPCAHHFVSRRFISFRPFRPAFGARRLCAVSDAFFSAITRYSAPLCHSALFCPFFPPSSFSLCWTQDPLLHFDPKYVRTFVRRAFVALLFSCLIHRRLPSSTSFPARSVFAITPTPHLLVPVLLFRSLSSSTLDHRLACNRNTHKTPAFTSQSRPGQVSRDQLQPNHRPPCNCASLRGLVHSRLPVRPNPPFSSSLSTSQWLQSHFDSKPNCPAQLCL